MNNERNFWTWTVGFRGGRFTAKLEVISHGTKSASLPEGAGVRFSLWHRGECLRTAELEPRRERDWEYRRFDLLEKAPAPWPADRVTLAAWCRSVPEEAEKSEPGSDRKLPSAYPGLFRKPLAAEPALEKSIEVDGPSEPKLEGDRTAGAVSEVRFPRGKASVTKEGINEAEPEADPTANLAVAHLPSVEDLREEGVKQREEWVEQALDTLLIRSLEGLSELQEARRLNVRLAHGTDYSPWIRRGYLPYGQPDQTQGLWFFRLRPQPVAEEGPVWDPLAEPYPVGVQGPGESH